MEGGGVAQEAGQDVLFGEAVDEVAAYAAGLAGKWRVALMVRSREGSRQWQARAVAAVERSACNNVPQ
eukprot:1150515-Pelagomonas_calceolata.AAC.4